MGKVLERIMAGLVVLSLSFFILMFSFYYYEIMIAMLAIIVGLGILLMASYLIGSIIIPSKEEINPYYKENPAWLDELKVSAIKLPRK